MTGQHQPKCFTVSTANKATLTLEVMMKELNLDKRYYKTICSQSRYDGTATTKKSQHFW